MLYVVRMTVLLALEEIAELTDASKAVEASGLLCQVKSFSFLLSLITFDRVLTCTKQLSDQLQSSTLDLSVASQLVAGTKSLLADYRSPDYWKKVYGYAERIANSHCKKLRVLRTPTCLHTQGVQTHLSC